MLLFEACENEKCLETFEKTLRYSRNFEECHVVSKYSVFGLSKIEEITAYTKKHTTENYYDDLLGFICYHELNKVFDVNKQFERVMKEFEEKVNH